MTTTTGISHFNQDAHISHELRISLTGITGMACFLNETPLTFQQNTYLQKLLVAANSILQITNRSNRLKDKVHFLSLMLERPLAIISKMIAHLSSFTLDAQQKEYVDIIQLSTRRLLDLKNNLDVFANQHIFSRH
jgi:signal transduction histidine kinase